MFRSKFNVDDWELDLMSIPPGVTLSPKIGSARKKWDVRFRGRYMGTATFKDDGTWSLYYHGRETRFRNIPNLKRAILYAVSNNLKRKG